MILDERTMRLIAVGASVTANCQPCLQTNVMKAREEGINEPEISAAIEVGKMVRKGAATKMDQFARSLDPAAPLAATAIESGCGCSL
jgi:AhpD family alkylhydroperoxidase